MSKYVIRFDDVTPDMNWDNFLCIKDVLEEYRINSILGVVPFNKDPKLKIKPSLSDEAFFEKIRTYKAFGDAVAQHGTYHIYTTKDSGILKINNKSEFAGHSYPEQLEKLRKGKQILQEYEVWQPYFMAPSHSFDLNTLKALKDLGFLAVTDGYGLYPYEIEGIKLLPQLVSKPIPAIPFGIQTICLHTNSMNKKSMNTLINFINNNYSKFISIDEALSINCNNQTFQEISQTSSKAVLQMIRKIKRLG